MPTCKKPHKHPSWKSWVVFGSSLGSLSPTPYHMFISLPCLGWMDGYLTCPSVELGESKLHLFYPPFSMVGWVESQLDRYAVLPFPPIHKSLGCPPNHNSAHFVVTFSRSWVFLGQTGPRRPCHCCDLPITDEPSHSSIPSHPTITTTSHRRSDKPYILHSHMSHTYLVSLRARHDKWFAPKSFTRFLGTYAGHTSSTPSQHTPRSQPNVHIHLNK